MEPRAAPVEIRDEPGHHRYVATVDGRRIGMLVYRRHPGVINLIHTEVDQDAGGHGVGHLLAARALDDARAQGLAVIPTCPFVARFLSEHPEYQDLVRPGPPGGAEGASRQRD
jgi:uncharacterized protein